jgi:hypothetical protein
VKFVISGETRRRILTLALLLLLLGSAIVTILLTVFK